MNFERTMLHIKNACIEYGEQILFKGFNLNLPKGEIACITGSSGCGKTSLLNALLGFTPLKEGSILLNNILLTKDTIDTIRKQTAWIPQELTLPMEWVKDMVQLPFTLKSNRGIGFSERVLFSYFDKLGVSAGLYNKRVCEISGGQRQRIMIAVAALMNKPLLIIDEPTSALDPGSTDLVLEFLLHQIEKGSAVLAVSHDRSFIAGCHQQIVMRG